MKFAITFLFATLCLPGEAQQRFHQATLHARDSILALMQASMIPGLSVTVSVEGETVWSEGFGFSDLEQKVKVDPARTRFRIGSISKSLTAAGLGRLYENNKIFPDSSIYFYLPDYPRLKYRPTVRQVAGHIGGVRHYRGNEFFIASHYRTVQEGLGIFKNDTLLFPPGTKYQYSSYGYNLVSAILEKAAGTDFLSFMNKEVFDPLELNHTSADVTIASSTTGRDAMISGTDDGSTRLTWTTATNGQGAASSQPQRIFVDSGTRCSGRTI